MRLGAPGRGGAGGGFRRYGRVWSLWGLGVSAVIAGEFSGWSYGLIEGGAGGLMIAVVLVSLMYLCLCFSLAELGAAMPYSGAAYAYGRAAMGVWGGYLAGLAQNIEYIIGESASVVVMGDIIGAILKQSLGIEIPDVALWAALYALFVLVNIHSVRLTFQLAIVLTVATIAVLAAFWIGAWPHFSMAAALDIAPAPGGTPWLPQGLDGIAHAIPFAIWIYLAIEQVTLCAEEVEEPARTLPGGLLFGIVTLIAVTFPTLLFASAMAPGAHLIGDSDNPLLLGFKTAFETASPVLLLGLTLVGQVASFHAGVYAYGRSLFALGRAGYLPRALARIHPTRRTPHVALIAGAVIGYAIAVVIRYMPAKFHVDAVLLNMSVFGAVISYLIQMVAYVLLARDAPGMARPYASPLGATGAMTALVICAVALALLFFNPIYRPGLAGCAVLFAIGVAYFALRRRRMLVEAPEEAFAETLRRSGGGARPQA
jgi:ethanolamine permease